MTLRTIAVLAAALGIMSACADGPDPAEVDVPLQPSMASLAANDFTSGSYLIVATGSDLPGDLAEQVAAAGGTLTGSVPAIGLAFAHSTNPAFSEQISGVQSVVPDLLIESVEPEEVVVDGLQLPSGAGDDEPFFGALWGLRAVRAPQAWEAGVRGAGVKVAVLDEGFDLDHTDVPFLAGQAQSFVCYDLVLSGGLYIVLTAPPLCESPDYAVGYPPADPYPTLTPHPSFSHGTHTSGTIAALDNGAGVIGVAPDAAVLPVKVLSEYLGGGFTSWIIQGIVHAADQGADVINMSLGGTATIGGKGTAEVMRTNIVAYRRAVDYAKKSGATVVVSAGNSALDADGNGHKWIRPAEFEAPLTISATAPYGIYYDPTADLDGPASYTNSGKSLVDFAAPGGDFSLFPDPAYYFDMVLSTGGANGYYWSAGTSMAAPHAAGIAALIIGEHNGSITPAQVEAEMRKRADDLGKPGHDDFYGKGRVSSGY